MDDIDKLIAKENSNSVLSGLARQCPKCGIISHYKMEHPPATRSSDPLSSFAAEDLKNRTDRDVNIETVMSVVNSHPGLTSAEMTGFCHLDRWEIARRLADLKNTDRAIQGRQVKRNGNRLAVTWYPADKQMRLF